MKIFLNILKYLFLSVLILLILIIGGYWSYKAIKANQNYALLGDKAPLLERAGKKYRDLNKNGKLDIYEDVTAPVEDRVNNLLSQMTVEEKAGTMYITMIGMTPDGELIDGPLLSSDPLEIMFGIIMPQGSEMVAKKLMNSFNIVQGYDAEVLAHFNNHIQELAESTRLGIPVTIATDPRHGNENNPGAAIYTPAFSHWPNSLGLAATRDTVLVKQFGDIARQEYLSTGIRLALHPMADLATEPRWARTNGTFGEDAYLSAMMTKAYILGFQGDSLNKQSVACMTKHFSGGGPQEDGEDAHFSYGKNQVYPGNNFDYHILPFTHGAFPAGTAQVMPYYGIPIDQTSENVAFGFNKEIITDLLRDSLKFNGVVCTDWNIINPGGFDEPRAWGVEHLTPEERTKKAIDAGCDQFGGEASPEHIISLVSSGQLTEDRIDESVRRILRDKFILGLFDNPYVNVSNAVEVVGNKEFREAGIQAQIKSTVLLKNDHLLPLKEGTKIYAEGMWGIGAVNNYGELVDSYEKADVVILRINTPFDPRSDSFLESYFHQGRLYYTDEELARFNEVSGNKPTIVIANLERPAILTPFNEGAASLIVEFGTSDEALMELLFGKSEFEGKLPFELPSSWEAVEAQLEDLPYDSEKPLYPFGFGL